MRASTKIPAWLFFAMTAGTAVYAAWLAAGLKSGALVGASVGLSFLVLIIWLAIMGLLTFLLGAFGIWRSRKLGEHIPMVYKLCLITGVAALIACGMLGVYR